MSNKFKVKNHLLEEARFVPSPNYDERPKGEEIRLLVIHCISLPPEQFGGPEVEAFFQNHLDCDQHPYFDKLRNVKVSSHLFIRRDGKIVQFVPFDKRAWHAGESNFKGETNCNNFSIGIELEGSETISYTDAQYKSLIECTRALLEEYPSLKKEHITGHSNIAPERKTDPGPSFDWGRLQSFFSG